MPIVKKYHGNYVDDKNKPFKITHQRCNGYVRCSGNIENYYKSPFSF